MGRGSGGKDRGEAREPKGSNKDKSTEHFLIVSVRSFEITEHVGSIKPHEY